MNAGPEFKTQTVQALRGKKLTVEQLAKIIECETSQMFYCLRTLREMGVTKTEEKPVPGSKSRWLLTGKPIPQDKKHHQADQRYDHSGLTQAMGRKP